jgi:glycosyltransferase involved in cell wall biosynthesis
VCQRIGPGGGPAGYLLNLRAALALFGTDPGPPRVEIAEVPGEWRTPPPVERLRAWVADSVPGIRRLRFELRGEFGIRFERAVRDWKIHYMGITRRRALELFACDLLFAHDVLLGERLTRLCPREARDRLVLMTHAPTFAAHQIAAELAPDDSEGAWREEPCVRRARDAELEVMEAVRAVAWPVPSASEGYPGWEGLVRAGHARPLLLRTGVPRPEPLDRPSAVRERWGISPGCRVALFMGRPHPHKGFDRFLDWATHCREQANPDWVFVFAGKPPRHTRRDLSPLRLVGYERDNAGAYLAADLVLIPNRYSYLDIGLLECLALGAPVAASPTGGHRDLIALCPSLPPIPEGCAEMSWPLLEALAESAGSAERRARHREAWGLHFSLESFVREHQAAVDAALAPLQRAC